MFEANKKIEKIYKETAVSNPKAERARPLTMRTMVAEGHTATMLTTVMYSEA